MFYIFLFCFWWISGGGTNIPYSSPGYGAFSFPKLNGSPSRPSNGIMPHYGPAHLGNGHTGTGTGFMGFGPTGFTTPIDTVLDRFGRTGTIFPSVSIYGNGNGPPPPPPAYMLNNGPINLHNGQPPGPTGPPGPAPNGTVPGPHRTLPPMVNRSNSLGRSLPPIPSKPPPLARRRTFEDEDERRMDWIWYDQIY